MRHDSWPRAESLDVVLPAVAISFRGERNIVGQTLTLDEAAVAALSV
jgi:hypothetical protein